MAFSILVDFKFLLPGLQILQIRASFFCFCPSGYAPPLLACHVHLSTRLAVSPVPLVTSLGTSYIIAHHVFGLDPSACFPMPPHCIYEDGLLANPIPILSSSAPLSTQILIAGYTAGQRAKAVPGSHHVATLAILVGTSITTTALVLLRVFPFEPRYIIPIAGMITGNAMTVTGVTMKRLREDIRLQHLEVSCPRRQWST